MHTADEALDPDLLPRMRRHWATCQGWLKLAEGWSAEDLAAAGKAIRAAQEARNAAILGCWADWLAQKASVAQEAAERCRAAERRVRLEMKR